MKQCSISRSIKNARSRGYLDVNSIKNLKQKFKNLNIPSHNKTEFDPKKWDTFVRDISDQELLEIRSDYSDRSDEYKVLSAMVLSRSKDINYIHEAFEIKIRGQPNNRLKEKVPEIVTEIICRVPLTTLLASWITKVYICDEDNFNDLVGSNASGYYHPEEHWIAIKYDAVDPNSEYWPVSRKNKVDHYEKSVTIHEFGHAFHYMLGLQTENADHIDNRNLSIEESELTIRKDINRGKSQARFCVNSCKAYALILDGTYDTLNYNNMMRMSVEEYMAECFTSYITAPRYIADKQPLAFHIYNQLSSYLY